MATNTYEALRTTNLTTAQASVTLDVSGITGYTDLIIVASVRATGATYNSMNFPSVYFNGDSSSGLYSVVNLYERNGSAASVASGASNALNYGGVVSSDSSSGIYSPYIIQLLNYSNTSMFKTSLAKIGGASNLTSNDALNWTVGLWKNTNAITTITLAAASGANFAADSTFTVYGIASEGEVVTTAKATGGTITYGPDYTYHVFTSGGTFTPSQALSCDYLVVAGGGGGGSGASSLDNGGGGGAGGYRTSYAQAFASGTGYTVTVGSGGAANANGVNSSIIGGAISFSATGGGRGSQYASSPGNGGSGGGASNSNAAFGTGNAGSYTPIEGNNGSTFQSYWAGGGGGAAYPGTFNGGGGDGYYTTLGPIPQYYAGGGGGGFNSYADRKGLPGLGGGGNGADYGGQWFGVAQAGTANTGGGGGGGASQGASIPGAAGGSGIVIIRYAS